MQLTFPIKDKSSYVSFQEILKTNRIIQPSILYKAYVLVHAFDYNPSNLEEFINQIRETYSFRKLENNLPRQSAYLSAILYNEIKGIEEALKTDRMF